MPNWCARKKVKLLGIDYGIKKIGLALAKNGLPYPFLVVKNQPGILVKLKRICQDYQVEKVILGLPEGKLVDKIFAFGQRLKEELGLPVEFQDETLTTHEAVVKMIETGKKKQARQIFKDAFAAALLLQAYLKQKENQNV